MKVAIYMRGKNYAIKKQEQIIKNIIGKEVFNNADKFIDKNCSGLEENRTMLDNFLNNAEVYDKLFITSEHILTRSPVYFKWVEKYLIHTKTELVFLNKENLKIKRKKNIEKGTIQHNMPFGYKKQNEQIIINKEEANIVKMIFELYSKNLSLYDIYYTFLELDIKNRKGNNFNPTVIAKMLDSELYIGNYYYNKHSIHYNENGKRFKIKHPKTEWKLIENLFPPIIEKEIFNQVQNIKNKYKKNGADIYDF